VTRRGVLWDMDGVLVDTGEFHYQSWAAVLPDYGIEFSREFFRETFGMNNRGILSLLLGEKLTPELLAEIGQRKEQWFRDAVRGHARPLPGVLEWLQRLRETGFRQGVASSAPPANISTLVDGLGLRDYFDVLASGVDLPGKPEPALFLKVARLLEVLPEHCIVVEDAVAGVEAARRAGMKCIALTTTNPAEALTAADVVVERLDALAADAFQRLVAGAEP
jgi:beta-phosphoglucomutase family hydrolase